MCSNVRARTRACVGAMTRRNIILTICLRPYDSVNCMLRHAAPWFTSKLSSTLFNYLQLLITISNIIPSALHVHTYRRVQYYLRASTIPPGHIATPGSRMAKAGSGAEPPALRRSERCAWIRLRDRALTMMIVDSHTMARPRRRRQARLLRVGSGSFRRIARVCQ